MKENKKYERENQILCYNGNKRKCRVLKEMVGFILFMVFENDKPTRRSRSSNKQTTYPTVVVRITWTRSISEIRCNAI